MKTATTHLTTGQAGQQTEGTCSVWGATGRERVRQTSARREPRAQAASRLTAHTASREKRQHVLTVTGTSPAEGEEVAERRASEKAPWSHEPCTDTGQPECSAQGEGTAGAADQKGHRADEDQARQGALAKAGAAGHVTFTEGRQKGREQETNSLCAQRPLGPEHLHSQSHRTLTISQRAKEQEENLLLQILDRQVQGKRKAGFSTSKGASERPGGSRQPWLGAGLPSGHTCSRPRKRIP